MCGIVGIAFMGEVSEEKELIRQQVAWYLSTELILATQTRGEDATGVAAVFNDGNYIGLKMGISASEFVARYGAKETDYTGFLKIWKKLIKDEKPRYAKVFMGHCRKTSVGSVYDNDNNHPIHVEPILGVHNGTLTNHDVVFKNIDRKRIGTVDSEAIFQLLHVFTKEGKEPITEDVVREVTKRLYGTYGVIAVNTNDPNKMALFRDGRPVVAVLIKKLNMIVIVSEIELFYVAAYRYNKEILLYNTVYDHKNNWPVIHKSDIEVVDLKDDHMAVINLKNTIETANKEDIIPQVRIERFGKIWESTKNVYGNTNYTQQPIKRISHTLPNDPAVRHNNTLPVVTTPTPTTTTTTTTSNNKGKVIGYLWIDDLYKFAEVTDLDLEELNKLRNVEIGKDEEDRVVMHDEEGEVVVYGESTGTTSSLQEGAIKKYKLSEKKLEDEEKSGLKIVPSKAEPQYPKIEVVMKTNPDYLKKASVYSENLPKVTNNKEVAELLGLSSEEDVDAIPSVPLTNIVRRKVAQQAYYDALLTVPNNKTPVTLSVKKVTALFTKTANDYEANRVSGKQVGTFKDFLLQNLRLDKGAIYHGLTYADLQEVFTDELLVQDPLVAELAEHTL